MKNGETGLYHIVVEGEIDASWSDWFHDFKIQTLTQQHRGCLSVLSGVVVDQAALRGILNKIFDLNLALVSVNRAGEE